MRYHLHHEQHRETGRKDEAQPRDWRIDTLINNTKRYGIDIRSHGCSHYVFSHPVYPLPVTLPAHRPIKPVYVKQFLDMVDSIKEQ